MSRITAKKNSSRMRLGRKKRLRRLKKRAYNIEYAQPIDGYKVDGGQRSRKRMERDK